MVPVSLHMWMYFMSSGAFSSKTLVSSAIHSANKICQLLVYTCVLF